MGYSKNGDPSFGGLCSFSCPLGTCPEEACTYTERSTVIPTVSPFLEPACTGGTGSGAMKELCEYSCRFGFCPIRSCMCTSTGGLVEPPEQMGGIVGRDSVRPGAPISSGLCAFSCSRNGGSCPAGICDISYSPVDGGKVDFRSITCSHPIIESHTSVSNADQWYGVGVYSAFDAIEDGFHYNISLGRAPIDFTNNASNYFHGPRDMYCENLLTSSGCSGFSKQCHDVSFPAGYFLLNSFSRLHDFHMDMLQGIRDAQINNNVTAIQATFGLPQKSSISMQIALDIALIGWGLIMGPTWPRISKGEAHGVIKDTTNDAFKWGLTLGKDLVAKIDGTLGQQNAMQEQVKTRAGVWVDILISSNTELFSGSLPGNLQLYGRIEDGALLGEGWRSSPLDFSRTVGRALNVFLIQQAWKTSTRNLYPVIIRENVACNANSNILKHEYITEWAYKNARFCGPDGKSYWLVAPRKWQETCNGGEYTNSCAPPGTPPGFEAITEKLFMDIGYDDLILGSIATYNKNGGQNGFKGWNLDSSSESLQYLNFVVDGGIRAPGFWNIPICSAEEVMINFEKAWANMNQIKNWSTFPCN
ncbi:hypothetical protein ONS96_004909 [Cadophora gregata f. sp. sojae]|nr:hypothetical protein ONS96_004909 [Cadophora gregata f. sp. sojae]